MAGPSPQGGVLEGANPVAYDPKSPITLFIIQATIVIIFCQLLHYPLRYVNQPRVIAEVIGGIILGPSVMMRIPGFKEHIFPTESMPVFNNVANLGLIIFLFLVALEVDIRLFTANWKIALSVGFAGMILPFGLGCAIAWGLFHQFRSDPGIVPISFGIYALFIGTAMAITAFPVLCRILTELKLLRSNVGVTVLAAGIGNDVTGWILLALCVALVNNGSGLAALWCLLCGVGWTLFLVYAVRPCFMWALRRTGSLQNGPTQGMVALTMLLTLVSAWFTGIVGIHPIFGAFLVGLICPHDGGFAIKMTEKIEDLISVLFLPLYFALSGLSTNLGLLNDGITWGYVIGIIAIAFAGKIIGGTIAAKLCGMLWRESASVGALMSCKGLVEIIVLNIGLQAKILSPRTFTMFVVMALVTTVTTTPLVKALYPPWYQQKVEKFRKGEINWDGTPTDSSTTTSQIDSVEKLQATQIRRLLVQLRLDSLPSLFTFISLLGSEPTPVTAAAKDTTSTTTPPTPQIRRRPLEVHGLRLIELTDRTSSVMQVTEGEEYYSAHDPVVNAFRTFSQLNDVAASGRVSVVPIASYAETLMAQAADVATDFVLVPWSEVGSVAEDQTVATTPYVANAGERFRNGAHLEFVQKTMAAAAGLCNSGIFINSGFGGVAPPPGLRRRKSAISLRSMGGGNGGEAALLPITDKSHHVFFPFFGGSDDRVALRFVLQLAKNAVVTVTITHFTFASGDDGADEEEIQRMGSRGLVGPSTAAAKNRAVEDDVSASDLALLHTLQSSLPEEVAGRVTFNEVEVAARTVLEETVVAASAVVGRNSKNAGDIVVVGRRHGRLGDVDVVNGSGDFRQTVGVVAERLVTKGVKASLLVIQAGGRGLELS